MSKNTEDKHLQMVLQLAKPGIDIITDLTANRANLLHMAVGVAGEAGELLDAVKKHAIYNKPIDYNNVVEELGDLEFYMAGVRAALSIAREDTLRCNMEKLAKRYPNFQYTNERAQKRADKE